MDRIYATIAAGSVEYDKDEAAVEIDELISRLEAAKLDGATHVVGLSGNYRGAKWVRIGEVDLDEDYDF
jgi:hypothetical protein